ncbi:MAG: HNH endonuclease [Rhodanobacter sp.]
MEPEPKAFTCLYCDEFKPAVEATLEHAIPQFLGGAYAPAHYALRNVCQACNNRLGLFVDAAYAKSRFVSTHLAIAARRLYGGLDDRPLPLICMGISRFANLDLPPDHVAEHWVGPSGETVIWLRPSEERFYWYQGGDPIATKRAPSTAFFFPTTGESLRLRMALASFHEAFRGKRTRKIFCANILDLPENFLEGFHTASPGEHATAAAIREALSTGSVRGQSSHFMYFDWRFMAKMALAVGYSLFGDTYLSTQNARDARRDCWETEHPESPGVPSLGVPRDPLFLKATGYPGAVSLTVLPAGSSYCLTLSINQQMPFTVRLAPCAFPSPFIDPMMGYALLLFPQMRQSIELTFTDLIAHQQGNHLHPELAQVDLRLRAAKDFQDQLSQMPSREQSPT